jgi:hypothetical protein
MLRTRLSRFGQWLFLGPPLREEFREVPVHGGMRIDLPELVADRGAAVTQVAVLWPFISLAGLALIGCVVSAIHRSGHSSANLQIAMSLLSGSLVMGGLYFASLRNLRARHHYQLTFMRDRLRSEILTSFFFGWTSQVGDVHPATIRVVRRFGKQVIVETATRRIVSVCKGYPEDVCRRVILQLVEWLQFHHGTSWNRPDEDSATVGAFPRPELAVLPVQESGDRIRVTVLELPETPLEKAERRLRLTNRLRRYSSRILLFGLGLHVSAILCLSGLARLGHLPEAVGTGIGVGLSVVMLTYSIATLIFLHASLSRNQQKRSMSQIRTDGRFMTLAVLVSPGVLIRVDGNRDEHRFTEDQIKELHVAYTNTSSEECSGYSVGLSLNRPDGRTENLITLSAAGDTTEAEMRCIELEWLAERFRQYLRPE